QGGELVKDLPVLPLPEERPGPETPGLLLIATKAGDPAVPELVGGAADRVRRRGEPVDAHVDGFQVVAVSLAGHPHLVHGQFAAALGLAQVIPAEALAAVLGEEATEPDIPVGANHALERRTGETLLL